MSNQAYDICHTQAGWIAVCNDGLPNGPLSLSQDGKVFLKNLTNAVDQMPLQVIKSRTYRKGGKAVHDMEARVNAQNGTGFRQITRYANNVARVTTDVLLKRNTEVKQAIQVGSFKLPGVWTQLMTIPAEGEPTTQALENNMVVRCPDTPLAWVFTREDGFQLELSAGFDLWRWNHAFIPGRTETVISVKDDAVLVHRNLLTVPENQEDAQKPEPRDYRFCYQLAWTTPSNVQKPCDQVPATVQLQNGNLPADFPTELSLDLNQLNLPDSAKVDDNHDAQACWESKTAVQAAKKIIRQLAAKSATGWLNIADGLTPAVCTQGRHVDRPHKNTPHWDLNGIICFAEWTRQTLGPEWKITFQPQGTFANLPSMKCLFGQNGFSVE